MRKIQRRALACLLVAAILAGGLGLFVILYFKDGGQWVSASFNRHLYSADGALLSGRVLDRDGEVLSQVENGRRVYTGDSTQRKAVLHAVGDPQGKIGTGALTAFADLLTGYNPITGVAAAAQGGGDVYLTIDVDCQIAAWRALNGRKGAVAVYNYETGQVVCMVSSPSYDPENIPADLETSDAYQGAYLNRVLSAAFTPGSIFKTVTLTAAIETIPDLFDRTWTCTGSTEIGGDSVTCPSAHGEMDIGDAFASSCNCVFGQLAVELGADTLAQYARKAGLTSSYSVSGIPTRASDIPLTDVTENQLAWAGVGQHHDSVNPLSMMVYMGAVAAGGQAAVPRLVDQVDAPAVLFPSETRTSRTGSLIQGDTARILGDMMAYNVTQTYGADRFGGLDVCAKSGTAEVGGGQSPHAWFTGFVRDADHPYAFIVLVENGGSGARVAGEVAAAVLAQVTSS